MSDIVDGPTLNARIREIAATEPNPSMITGKILSEIDYAEARVIAQLTLREHVRRVISHTPRTPPRRDVFYPTADGRQTPSPRVAGVRDRWVTAKLLEVLQTKNRRHIYLRDATPNDLLWAEQSRLDKAAATTTEAKRHRRAHDELIERGLSHLGELPDEVIIAIYRD